MSTADTIWTAEGVCSNLNILNIQLLNTNVKYIGTRWYIQNKTSTIRDPCFSIQYNIYLLIITRRVQRVFYICFMRSVDNVSKNDVNVITH